MTEAARLGAEAPGETAAPAAAVLAGHNRISTAALTSVAEAVAANVLGVSASRVRATWQDDGGLLALSLVLPIGVPPLAKVVQNPFLVQDFGGSVWGRAKAARSVIRAEVSRLTGSRLSRVDIRIVGVHVSEGGRVR